MEAAPSDQGDKVDWGAYGTAINGADGTAVGDGSQNTADIIAHLGTGSTYPAQRCDGLSVGGYSDWFLPSNDELYEMCVNLYSNGLGGFSTGGYWCSTEQSANLAWHLPFLFGTLGTNNKLNNGYVRAARAF